MLLWVRDFHFFHFFVGEGGDYNRKNAETFLAKGKNCEGALDRMVKYNHMDICDLVLRLAFLDIS